MSIAKFLRLLEHAQFYPVQHGSKLPETRPTCVSKINLQLQPHDGNRDNWQIPDVV
jgi:hypothetical protein